MLENQEYEKALSYYDSALKTAREINNGPLERKILSVIASAYMRLSQYNKAVAYYDSSLLLARRMEDRTSEGFTLSLIGASFSSLDQYEKSLAYYDSALFVAEETKNLEQQGLALRYIGQLYYTVGDYEKALAYCSRALAIYDKTKASGARGVLLSTVGGILAALKQYDKALAYCDSGLIVARETQDSRAEAIALHNIAGTYQADGRHEEALAYYDSSLTKRREVKHRHGEASVLTAIGEAHYLSGHYDKALAYYDSALTVLEEIRNRSDKSSILEAIGQVHEATADYEDAIYYYKESIEIKESIRAELHQEQLIAAYAEVSKNVYERLVTLLIMLELYEEAFDYLERSHSEKLRKSFEMGEMTAYDPSLKRQLERINFLQGALMDARKVSLRKNIADDEYISRVNELQGELNQHFLDLKYFHPELYNVFVPRQRSLRYIQNIIPENTTILEFTVASDEYAMFLVAHDRFVVRSTEHPKSDVDNLIKETLNLIRTKGILEQLDKNSEMLYDILIEPFDTYLENYEHIIIIPYGYLHYLPFHALKKHERDPLYFVQSKSISYLPSASFLEDLLRTSPRAREDLVAFANCDGTLPSTEIEVDSIQEIYPQSTIYKTDSATKKCFLEHSQDYTIVHLATHGVLDIDPRFSHITLAPKGLGNLTVREIAGLSGHFTNTTLVTLSACETAIEENSGNAGMELTTLANAFKVAGISSIVATLWEIADRATAILMSDFYRNLRKENSDKLAALRQAQINMAKHERYRHPYYWAPFVLIGGWK